MSMSKVAVITGASKGIGYAAAEIFLLNNWQVVNLSRQPCHLAKVINVTVDLQQADWPIHCQSELTKQLSNAKQICVVHNAANYQHDAVSAIDPLYLRQALEVNVVAPTRLNQLCLPHMSPGSSLLYIGSTLSEIGTANAASYTITKHALLGLMRATCQDLAAQKIHTCCIAPGFTSTEMLLKHLGNDPAIFAEVTRHIALGRLAQPEEIARLIYFAAENPVINGALLHANLGQLD